MKLRRYRVSDCSELTRLFYDTVHSVCARDYTPEQLDAWADGHPDLETWDRSLRAHDTLVVEEGGRILGFGDMTADGYLDRLFVHREAQGRGIPPPCAPRGSAAAPLQSLRSTRHGPHGPSSRAGGIRWCGSSRWSAEGSC